MKKISHILLVALSFSVASYAADFVVPSGTTVTTTQTLTDDGDVGLIEKGGAIEVAGGNGVIMAESNQTVLNQGFISITGDSFNGINSFINNDNVITNSGLISVTANGSSGIASSSDTGCMITNSGLISITGDSSFGIFSFESTSNLIVNSGQIFTTGTGADGIFSISNNDVITNSGLILASGVDSGGVVAGSGMNQINVQVINSGTIISVQSFAINLGSFNSTLNLLRGSNLQGAVSSTVGPLHLNVETGLNLALTLDPTSVGFGSLGIEAPFVQIGDTIGVIDPTGLTLQADVLADLSDTILDGIYRHRTGCCTPYDCGLWTQGIGSYRKRGQDRGHVGYDNWQGGFLIGCDAALCKGYVGIFGGATFGKAEVDAYTQTADINTYVGGFSYEGCFCDTFVGGALVLGYVDWDNDRFVMNNLVPGGVQTAQASLNGLLISPEITLARPLDCIFCHPLTSFTLRYAGLFFGDYNEKGSLTNLSVNDREIDLLKTRLEAAFPFSHSCANYCWSVEPYLGLFGRFQVGGNRIDGELLDEPLYFTQRGSPNLAAFLFGFRGIQSIGCLDLFLNIEASFDNEKSSRILGEGGLAWHF